MMWLFFLSLSRGARELLPCGLQWRKLVEVFEKEDSRFLWFDFTVAGKRYRGSTKETNRTRAEKIAALKLTQALEGKDPLPKKALVLAEFSVSFLEAIKNSRLEKKSKVYYQSGWRL